MAYGELRLSGAAPASGTLRLPWRSGRQTWNVQQVTVECPDAPGGATCELRKNGALITPLVAASDAAGGDPPILQRPPDVMAIQWDGLDVGNAGYVLVIYDDGT